VGHCNRARQINVDLCNTGNIHDNVLVGANFAGRNNKSVRGITVITNTNPDLLNDIEEAKLEELFDRCNEFKRNHTASFVGFPLGIVGLLDNQNISIFTGKSWGTVTIVIDSLRSVKQAG